MLGELVSLLLQNLGGAALGFAAGQFVTWRRGEIWGTAVPVPTRHLNTDRTTKALSWVLVIIAIVTIAQGALFQIRQGDCNEQFRTVIAQRGADSLRQTEANVALQREILEAGTRSDVEAQSIRVEARQHYIDLVEELNEKRRANPYPDPRC